MKKLLLFLLVLGSLAGVSEGQTFVTGQPFQIIKKSFCTSASCVAVDGSASTTGFPVAAGIGFFKLSWTTDGTVSTCAISIDSQDDGAGSWTTGGIASSATVGSCASAGSYSNSSAVYKNFARLTVAITGSGNVTFTLLGNVFQSGTGSASAAGIDPCQNNTRTIAVINLTASGQLLTGVAAKQTYICYIQFALSGAADNIALVEGTGSTCGTGTLGMAGGATAATGWNLLANGSVTGGTISNWGFKTGTAADNVCLLASSAAQISGVVEFVQQ